MPITDLARRLWRLILRSTWRFLFDDGLALASNIAFSVLMSLFPFLILLAAIPSYFGGDALMAEIRVGLFSLFPGAIAGALEPEVVSVLSQNQGGILTFGIVILLLTITSAIESIRYGLNRAYGGRDRRSFLFRRVQSILFVLGGGAVLLLTALLAVAVPLAFHYLEPHVPHLSDLRAVVEFARLGLIVLVLAAFLFAMHHWLPARRQGLRELAPGVLATLVLWFVSGWGFSWYLSHFATYARTYAGLAGAVATLMFFYIAAVVLLYGAEFNAALLRLWPTEGEAAARLAEEPKSES
ncbi:MAG: YihY/virulence factor BrkB family protein [Hyphomicrobiales bacterium]